MKKRLITLLLVSAMAISTLAGCGNQADTGATSGSTTGSSGSGNQASDDGGAGTTDAPQVSEGVTDFTMFITMPGSEINSDNEIAQIIADKWGVKVKETWLTGQTAAEATGTLIASGEYPDYIDSDDMALLVDAGALVPLDDYIDQYPDFKNEWFTPEEWEKFRSLTDISTGSILSATLW